MKNKKILILSLILIILIIFSYISFSNIYAKYLTKSIGSASIPMSRWDISINNISLKTNKNFSSNIIPVFPGNDYIASGIIAPSAEGYFDLVLDYSNVDVTFKYDISTAVSENSSVTDLIPIKYSIDSNEPIYFQTPADHIIDTISYSNPVKTRTIRIYVKWDESENSTMTNIDDTNASNSNNPALFDINANFTQLNTE